MSIYENKPWREITFQDSKWQHPEGSGYYNCPDRHLPQGDPDRKDNPIFVLDDPNLTNEQKAEMYDSLRWELVEFDEDPEVEMTEVEAPGCVEEPETPVKLLVYVPKAIKESGKKAPVLLYLAPGGFMFCRPRMNNVTKIAKNCDCIVVAPYYRPTCAGQMPGQLNDCHAGYQWIIDNADEWGMDASKIVVYGCSAGALFALGMPFRLARYGIMPSGVVVSGPMTDIAHQHWQIVHYYKDLFGEKYGSVQLGPEFLPNHATVEECIGYPPLFIHSSEHEVDRDNTIEFYHKVLEAHSFAEMHVWGGVCHTAWGENYASCPNTPLLDRIVNIIYSNIKDCFKYDLSRPWLLEDFPLTNPSLMANYY